MQALRNIVIFGSGLAAHITAVALSKRLPENIGITFVKTRASQPQDIFYGHITSPSTYDFLLSLAISEPQLLLGTNTTFSLGTNYEDWGTNKRNWIQAFYKPLPIHDGVKFHHYVNRHEKGAQDWDLGPYIMSIEAARKGVFAHPPEGKKIPLASVNYGYHLDINEWTRFLSAVLDASRVKIITANTKPKNSTENSANSITLANGEIVEGDLFINCMGQYGDESEYRTRALKAQSYTGPQDKISDVICKIKQTSYGWLSETPLRGERIQTHFYHPKDEVLLPKIEGLSKKVESNIAIWRSETPWSGNVLKLGHSAGAIEPLSPAPIMLLQHDIERLIDLIPTSTDMRVEAREYNRRYTQDYDNAAIFHRALLREEDTPANHYQKAIISLDIPTKLQVKITQFESRGVCVLFDNEPFNEEDWTQLHLGMGRIPARYDPLAARIPDTQIHQMLSNMRAAISQMGSKMPPVDIYMTGLLKFLKDKHG